MNVLCPSLCAIQTGILQGASETGTLDIVFLQTTEMISQLLTNKTVLACLAVIQCTEFLLSHFVYLIQSFCLNFTLLCD